MKGWGPFNARCSELLLFARLRVGWRYFFCALPLVTFLLLYHFVLFLDQPHTHFFFFLHYEASSAWAGVVETCQGKQTTAFSVFPNGKCNTTKTIWTYLDNRLWNYCNSRGQAPEIEINKWNILKGYSNNYCMALKTYFSQSCQES